MRKIEGPTDELTGFEMGDTAADIQRRGEEIEQRKRVKETEKQQREEREREEAMRVGTPQSQPEEPVPEKEQGLRGVKV